MPPTVSPLAVVGPAGSGHSSHTERWADEVQRSTGRSCRRFDAGRLVEAPPSTAQRWMSDLLDTLNSDHAVVIENVQWVVWSADELLDAMVDHLDAQPEAAIAVTSTGWPTGRRLDVLIDVIAQRGSLVRTGPLDLAEFGVLLADRLGGLQIPVDGVASVHHATGGMFELAEQALDFGWIDRNDRIPPALADAVLRGVRRQPDDVVRVAEFCCLGADPGLARRAVASTPMSPSLGDGDELERACRASGLFDGDRLIPLVSDAIDLDVTAATRSRRALQLLTQRPDHLDLRAQLISMLDDTAVAELELTPSEIAAAALHLGEATALGSVAALADDEPDAEVLRFVVDVRMLRWERAAERRLGPDLGALAVVAGALVGHLDDDGAGALRPSTWVTVAASIVAWAHGDVDTAITAASRAADDATHDGADRAFGITPAALAALVSISAGDATLAVDLLDVAIRADTGGPAERRFHHQLHAFASLQLGRYQRALDLVREGDDERWMHRDRLVLAAIDVALARRSGDTARLRDGWRRAELLLASNAVSWLFADLLIELLAAGARLGDVRRTGPIQRSLVDQLRALPSGGPGPTTAAWVDAQMAVATQDWSSLADAASLPGGSDARSRARRSALDAWRSIGAGRADDAQVRRAADELGAVGDAWEASRLLGQAALDHPDPAKARSLLESARTLVSSPTDAHDSLVAAGLSEREAEVARLVVEGNTHREIGATLFVSPKTVEHHVAKIRQRLGASSRAEMIARVRELGDS